MANTKIEWTEKTWNPVTGCTKCSPGCANCYAERMSKRLAGRCGYPADEPFTVIQHLHKLEEPFNWRKPVMCFVCSMGDLFHDDVPFAFIKHIWKVMAANQRHTFQILTKRPRRMMEFTQWMAGADDISVAHWPGNVWLGVTTENQEQADKRIPLLLQTPAAVRFVSVEPMLEPLFIRRFLDRLDWIICGGETGPGARPMHPDWPRALRDQCQAAGVPFFFKSWGNWKPISEMSEIETNALYCPAPESDPEAARRCKVASRAVQYDGEDGYRVIDRHFGYQTFNVGKKAAGHLLDGKTHEETPT